MKSRNALLAIFITSLMFAALPCFAQTTPINADPPSASDALSPEIKAAKEEVKTFQEVYAVFKKAKGVAYAVDTLYTDDYVQVDQNGKETNKTELLKQIAEGRAFISQKEWQEQSKEVGNTLTPLPKDKQTWRPDRYEVSDDYQVYVYTSPVQKSRQILPPRKNGEATGVDIKILFTVKETYKRERKPADSKTRLYLKRTEVVGMKTYINGKEQSAGFGTGKVPPKL